MKYTQTSSKEGTHNVFIIGSNDFLVHFYGLNKTNLINHNSSWPFTIRVPNLVCYRQTRKSTEKLAQIRLFLSPLTYEYYVHIDQSIEGQLSLNSLINTFLVCQLIFYAITLCPILIKAGKLCRSVCEPLSIDKAVISDY